MKIHIDQSLPIAARQNEIRDLLRTNQVVVVAGETGSGKTTQLPKIAWQLGYRSIAHTQPRRIAARSVAQRIADECDVPLGGEVGYAVRFEDHTSGDTQLRLMTDGLLLAEIHRDRDLRAYDTIVIDEAHERSLAIDFLLGYLARLLPRRPDLKVIVTSATIEVERFAAMFDAPVIEVSGRMYPVEIRYRPPAKDQDVMSAVGQAIGELPRDGDVLVFLSGEREIRDAGEYLGSQEWARTEVIPLYGRLAAQDQHRVFASHTGRRIVLATNIAETSVTVPGIKYVIDAGFARISRYSQRLKVQRLPIEPISQASASQRAGRCGRTSDGICVRLYSEEDFHGRPEYTDPEIQRTNLASVLLQMAVLDLGDIRKFPFLDPPDTRAVKDGQALLTELGAWRRNGRLSGIGNRLAQLPLDPRMGRMLLAADRAGCLADVLVIVSAMSIQDPRERPVDAEAQADAKHVRFHEPTSDFLSYLTLWQYIRTERAQRSRSSFRRMCKAEYLHYLRIREWHDVHSQLRQTVKSMGMAPGHPGADPDDIHRALIPGLLSHLGLKDEDTREYSGARGTRFKIFPGSGLARKPPRWVMAAELVETSRLWARTVAQIDPSWVEKAAKHLVKRQYGEPHWSSRRGVAMAREHILLYGLPLVTDRAVPVSRYDTALARELFIRHGLVEGMWDSQHAFFIHNRALLDDVESLQERVRRRDIRVDDEDLFEFYDARIPADIISTRHFDAWWKNTKREDPQRLHFDIGQLQHRDVPADVDELYPRQWRSESQTLQLNYVFEPGAADDGVIVDIPFDQLMQVDERQFSWGIPGHRAELIEALIRSLPKRLRKLFVPAPQIAQDLATRLDSAAGTDVEVTDELAQQMRHMSGTDVQPSDFDFSMVPAHLTIMFRVVDAERELERGQSLSQLRNDLAPKVRAELDRHAQSQERHGIRTWDVGLISQTVQIGQATGYPALIDEHDGVGLTVLDSRSEQHVAMVQGQARLISFAVPSPTTRLGRDLDMRAKLLLASGPYRDAAAVIDECFITALDRLVQVHGGPVWNEAEFALLCEHVREDFFTTTETLVSAAVQTFQKLSTLSFDGATDQDDVHVQISWLIYPGFIRESGAEHLQRIPVYVEAARRHLNGKTSPDLPHVQDLEARFHDKTESLPPLARLDPQVQHVRWALEELRLSIFAQQLGTAFPVSIKRVSKLLDQL